MTSSRRIGLNWPLTHSTSLSQPDLIRHAEALGFTDLWSQETDGPDAFTPLAIAAAISPTLRLGSAVASIFTRGPALLAMQAASMADAAPGRFMLGLGTSSAPIVERWNGLVFERPCSRMSRTLDFLEEVFETGRCSVSGPALGCEGFRLGVHLAEPPPIYLAALGPRMLELAATRARGVLLSLVPPDLASRLVERYRAAERNPGQGEVVLRIGCLLCDDREDGIAQARRILAGYLSVPTYAALYASLGEGERVARISEAFRNGRREDAMAAVPADWAEGVFAIGSAEEIALQVGRFREAGIDTPIIAPTVFSGSLRKAMAVWAKA